MAEQVTYTCDECGVQKGASNHWWRLAKDVRNGVLMISPWNIGPLDRSLPMLDLCGQACVTRRLSKLLNPASQGAAEG